MNESTADWTWGDPIPSPSEAFINIGPLNIHYYAIFILVGIVLAIWMGNRR